MGIFRNPFKKAVAHEVPQRGNGWARLILEPFAGAWQRNKELPVEDILGYHAVFACITLIAGDGAKLGLREQEKRQDVWTDIEKSAITKRLARPNGYQNGGQFVEAWLLSKLTRGNTYVYKEEQRGAPPRMHVLDPDRCRPLITESGEVLYEIAGADLLGKEFSEGSKSTVVPSDQIIHDRFNCLYHPLVGISPIYAAALAIHQGREIQKNSAEFFSNGAMPGGVLTAPGSISDETAERLKTTWEQKYRKGGRGGLAVLGDGLQYNPLSMTSVDAQLVEQLRWSAEVVCSVFHVPPYKIGVGAMPSYDNVQALNQEYFAQALQRLIIDMQRLLREGLNVEDGNAVRFDLSGLLTMDSKTQMEVHEKGTRIGAFHPNYTRAKFGLAPVEGGDTPYLQQQNFPLASLANRAPPDTAAPVAQEPSAEDVGERAYVFESIIRKELANHEYHA